VRGEWGSGFAGKLKGSGFSQHAVITRLEKFRKLNKILHSFHVYAPGKTIFPARAFLFHIDLVAPVVVVIVIIAILCPTGRRARNSIRARH
jgi:hypothetical protein